MYVLILRVDIFIRLILIVIFLLVQSCSNTTIGNKLEDSFDLETSQNSDRDIIQENSNKKKEVKKLKKIKSDQNSILEDKKILHVDKMNIKIREQKPVKKTNERSLKNEDLEKFKPQPYRIILKLSGVNPSAPAETVTKALRKAGVKFEVEKIERFNMDILPEKSSSRRKEF